MKRSKKEKRKLTKREKIFLAAAVVLLILQLFLIVRFTDSAALSVKSYIGEDAPQRLKNAVFTNLALIIPIWAILALALADLFIRMLEMQRHVKKMEQVRRELTEMMHMQEGEFGEEETPFLKRRISDRAIGIFLMVMVLLFGVHSTYEIFTDNALVNNGIRNMSKLDRDIKEKTTLIVEGEVSVTERVYSLDEAEDSIRAPMYLRLVTDDGERFDFPISGSDRNEIRRAFGWTEEQIKYPFAYKQGTKKLGRMKVEYYENTLMIVRYEVLDSVTPEEQTTPEKEQEPEPPAAEPEAAPDSAPDSPDSDAPNEQQERGTLINEANERYMSVIGCLKSDDTDGLKALISTAAIESELAEDEGERFLDSKLDRLCELYGSEDAELEPFTTFTDLTVQDGKHLLETARYIVTGGRRLYLDIYFCIESSEEGDIGIYRISLSDFDESSPTYGEMPSFNGSYAVVGHY